MKNRSRLFLLIVICLVANHSAKSQSINKLVIGSSQDANYLVSGYASPALSVIGYGLNQGWYNTAKPHKILGFDITATVNFIKVPSSALNYYVDNSKLSSVQLVNGSNGSLGGNVSTAFGPNVAPTYQLNATGTQFSGAPGIDLSQNPVMKNTLPVPMAQIGVGLPKGLELKFRFVPKTKFGDNKDSDFSLFGIGLMHDLKQYLPGIKLLPFDLSGFVGYTNMKFNIAFDKNHGQMGTVTSNATTIQGVISKKVSVLTGYAGLGYNFANTKASVNGNYNLNGDGTTYLPINVNMSGASTGPRATFGLRLKLTVLTLHGEYTAQKYSSITIGAGISVR